MPLEAHWTDGAGKKSKKKDQIQCSVTTVHYALKPLLLQSECHCDSTVTLTAMSHQPPRVTDE